MLFFCKTRSLIIHFKGEYDGKPNISLHPCTPQLARGSIFPQKSSIIRGQSSRPSRKDIMKISLRENLEIAQES